MNIRNIYKKSLQMIKEVKSKKEYIELIDKENLLSVPSLEYISGKGFNNLIREVQKSDDTLNDIKSLQNRLNRQEKDKNKKPW